MSQDQEIIVSEKSAASTGDSPSKVSTTFRKSGIFAIAGRAFRAMLENILVLLALVCLSAYLDAGLLQGVFEANGVNNFDEVQAGGQSQLITVILSWTGLHLLKVLLLGPLIAATIVYTGRNYTQNKKSTVYGSINFMLSRYKRLFIPFLTYQLMVNIGMIIVIPGVMFLMQFAFADAVACLEDEKHPLTRSKRLTRGRRRSLFLLIIPWALGSQLVGLAALALSNSILAVTGVNALMDLLYVFMFSCFFMLYEERNWGLSLRRASRDGTAIPVRALRKRKLSLGGLTLFIAFMGAEGVMLKEKYNESIAKQQNGKYAQCVISNTESKYKEQQDKGFSFTGKSLQSICESAKGQCVKLPHTCIVKCQEPTSNKVSSVVDAESCQ